jgi:glycosyltransferase involved in cell wall biosynthesis
MIGNCRLDAEYAVVEITNELPFNRLGGVGSAVASLIGGFSAIGLPVLWYLVDHHYTSWEIDVLLREHANVAVGSLNELKAISAPIAHLHTYNHDPAIVSALQGRRTIFTVHSLLRCEAESNGVDLSWAVQRQEHLIAACDEIVLVSNAELGHYRRLGYEALNARARVIHNGLAHRPLPPLHPARRALGFCGRLVPRKRHEYVQWILGEEGFDAYSSLIAGRCFSTYARNLVAGETLAKRVRYLGWCGGERLESFYRQIDVLAIPSVYEPFGMVALEAVSRGIPVVCAPTDGLLEILGEEAIYAEDGSYDSFRRAMQRWRVMAPSALESMAARAHRRFSQRFTDVVSATNYRFLFESVA